MVLEAAEKGDDAATGILKDAAAQLTDQLAAMVARMGSHKSVGVVFIGGLVQHGALYARIVAEAVHARLPQVQMRQPLYTPAQGAVIMARDLLKRNR
jgi:N-acetylglucosamine kinase-like BadF-type ATPase